jgi:hypothetical protein
MGIIGSHLGRYLGFVRISSGIPKRLVFAKEGSQATPSNGWPDAVVPAARPRVDLSLTLSHLKGG